MDAVDRINRKYRKRIMAHMNTIREYLLESDFEASEVSYFDNDGDHCYELTVNIYHDDEERDEYNCGQHDITITLKIVRSPEVEMRLGLNFVLDVFERGGKILGGLIPYNYTDRCWVRARDLETVARRFNEFMYAASPDEVLAHVQKQVEG